MIRDFELGAPLIYFRGIASGQYLAFAPAFIVAVDRTEPDPARLEVHFAEFGRAA